VSTLQVTSGPAAGESRDIDREILIGREAADLTIGDPEISRQHAAIRPVERGIEIEDLGSRNGTFVNGERIHGNQTLTETATVRVGTTEITVEMSA